MLTQDEFEEILADRTKRIDGDILWTHDEDHSQRQEFRAIVASESDWGLWVYGNWNPANESLSLALIHGRRTRKNAQRIIGLDIGGPPHRNPKPDRTQVGKKHKHRWSVEHGDKWAYVPEDITAAWNRPLAVWKQFCLEVRILHLGEMRSPDSQEELRL